jgi:hypothetical protein
VEREWGKDYRSGSEIEIEQHCEREARNHESDLLKLTLEAATVLADCVIMLDSYLANDSAMDDILLQKALKLADLYRTK